MIYLINDFLQFNHSNRHNILSVLNFISDSDNIGNLVFIESIQKLLPESINISSNFFIENSSFFKKNSTVILPLANFISDDWVCSDYFIERLKNHRVILFSVGIQNEISSISDLSPSALSILNLAKKSRTTVGTRGAITSKLLDHLTIDNITIGCPSVLTNTAISKSIKNLSQKSVRICTSNTHNGKFVDIAKKINHLALMSSSGHILQTEVGIIADKYNIPADTLNFLASFTPNQQHSSLLRNKLFDYGYYSYDEWSTVREWYMQHAQFFTNCQDWRSWLKQFDIVVGTRFHGGILGFQSGSIPIYLRIDSRVSELVDYHNFSSFNTNYLLNLESLHDLDSHLISTELHFDFRSKQKDNLIDFLKSNFLIENYNLSCLD